jgi:hypothetical protein
MYRLILDGILKLGRIGLPVPESVGKPGPKGVQAAVVIDRSPLALLPLLRLFQRVTLDIAGCIRILSPCHQGDDAEKEYH